MLKLEIKKEYMLETASYKIDVLGERIYQDRYILLYRGLEGYCYLYDIFSKKEICLDKNELGKYDIITEEYINDKKWSIV